jgi:hypothetical protein
MTRSSVKLILIAVSTIVIGTALINNPTASAVANGTKHSPSATNPELAHVRAATTKYHEVSQAEADGYININFCEPGEGCHWLNPSLIDANIDPTQPEILLYAPGPGNSGLRLVAVEYVVPLTLSPGVQPVAFSDDAESWRVDTEGAGLWELTAWVWLHNPNGIFEQHNPHLP